MTAKVKSPLLFACHLAPLHNHPEWAVITPPLKRGIGRTALLRKMNRWTLTWRAGVDCAEWKRISHFLRIAAHIHRQCVSGNVDTSPCHTKWNNFHSYTEETKKLPKELCCWMTEWEFHPRLKHLQGDASLSYSQNNYLLSSRKEKKKCPVSLTWCNVITNYVATAGF